MDLRFFHRLGATLLDRKPLCGGIRTEAWIGTYGAAPGIRPEQVAHAQADHRLGQQRHVVEPAPRRRSSTRRGAPAAKLVVVDPRRTKIAEQADLHIALRPGTDVVLAWAMAAELERRGGLDRAFIARTSTASRTTWSARAATRWPRRRASAACPRRRSGSSPSGTRTLSPAAISVGNGLERNQNGGSGIRAIFALPALAGKWGVPGRRAASTAPGSRSRRRRRGCSGPDLVPAGTRTLNIVDVGRHLTRPDAVAADQGGVHLQPQPGHRASRPEPDAARPRARGPLHGGRATW